MQLILVRMISICKRSVATGHMFRSEHAPRRMRASRKHEWGNAHRRGERHPSRSPRSAGSGRTYRRVWSRRSAARESLAQLVHAALDPAQRQAENAATGEVQKRLGAHVARDGSRYDDGQQPARHEHPRRQQIDLDVQHRHEAAHEAHREGDQRHVGGARRGQCFSRPHDGEIPLQPGEP